MTYDERLEISLKLQKYHYFFRAFWDIGAPIMGEFDDLPTAAISFDENGNQLNLIINQSFWNSLNEETKMFLICHEILHIVLCHGKRFAEYIKTPRFSDMNIAADVVINEALCASFGFKRIELDNTLRKEGCWLDTVFKDDKTVLKEQSTEYYFNRIKNDDTKKYFVLDQHRVLTPGQQQQLEDLLVSSGIYEKLDGEFIGKLPNTVDTKEAVKNIQAGMGYGSWGTVNAVARKKSKWETVIKKWESKVIKDTLHTHERWERVGARYSHLISDEIALPTENWILDDITDNFKIDVFFFLDTSGSCIGLKDRFFKAARSLDPKRFNIRLFNFDTRVVEVNIKENKVYGGGGTSFIIIEEEIQKIIKKEKIKYPKAVWLITDAEGDHVSPEKPERWHWFLTSSSDDRRIIPEKSKVYLLKNYE